MRTYFSTLRPHSVFLLANTGHLISNGYEYDLLFVCSSIACHGFCGPFTVLFLSCPVVITAAFAEGFYVTIWCLLRKRLESWGWRVVPWCILTATAMSWRDIPSLKVSPGSCGVPFCQPTRKPSRKLWARLSCIVHCTAETSTAFFPDCCVSVVKLGVKTFCRPYCVQRREQIEKCVACHHDQWYTSSLLGFFVWLQKEGRVEQDGSHSRWCDWSTC